MLIHVLQAQQAQHNTYSIYPHLACRSSSSVDKNESVSF
jgi:hypothetical protein